MALTGVMDGCAWCEVHKDRWADPEAIKEGFKLTRTMEGMQELWTSLPRDKHGEVVRATGDWNTRKGLCHAPVTIRPLFHFTVCHKVRRGVNLQYPFNILNDLAFNLVFSIVLKFFFFSGCTSCTIK